MSYGPVFVERIDYEAAVAYLEAHLPEDVRPYADRMATETIDAALVGVRETKVEEQCLVCGFPVSDHGWRGAKKAAREHLEPGRRFVTDWEEVGE